MSNKPSINVNAKGLDVGSNATMTREEAVEYAKSVVEKAASIHPNSVVSAEVVLVTEGDPKDPVQKARFKMILNGNVIVQQARSRSIKKAIERAQNDLERQSKKLKDKKVGVRQRKSVASKRRRNEDAKAAGDVFLEKASA